MNVQKRIADLNTTIEGLRSELSTLRVAPDLVDQLNYAADHLDLSVRLFEDVLGSVEAKVSGEMIDDILEDERDELIADDLIEVEDKSVITDKFEFDRAMTQEFPPIGRTP